MSSPEKIKKVEAAIASAKQIMRDRLYTYDNDIAKMPVFAEIVRYFLEEESEDNKQLLKD